MSSNTSFKTRLPDLTNQIVETYQQIGSINHLGHTALPSREAIVQILFDLTEVLYPGYRRRQNLHLGNVVYHTGDLIDGIYDSLSEQIARALEHESRVSPPVDADGSAIDFLTPGQARAFSFLESLPEMRRTLAADVQAAFDGDPAAKNLDEIIFCYPGLEAITVHRIAHELYRLQVPFIPRIMSEWSHSRTGIDIHPGAQIGPSFFIDHGTGVVIGETTVIESNVKLYQGVTLGALSFPKDENGNIIRGAKRHPTIEEGVVIYANATVLGGDTVIGKKSVIGSSCAIMKSVPANTQVTLERAQLRFREAS
ncbi:MAG: serine acetyltransferase [Planctomycetes bacterium]|nr:serine acetyltransferase [Planctomycetota bacterium]